MVWDNYGFESFWSIGLRVFSFLIYTFKTKNHHHRVNPDQYKKYTKKCHHGFAPLVNKRKFTLFVMLYGQKDRSDAQILIFMKNVNFWLFFKEIFNWKEN